MKNPKGAGECIEVVGARENNLKDISLAIPKNKFVVITGLSGSGKSSLAFDTLYAEGQRRYMESLSSYVRQFLHMHNKPDVDSISGLSPAIAIDQKGSSRNSRSTVGTVTEIYDYLRLLYARIGIAYSPATGLPIQKQSASQITDKIRALGNGVQVRIFAPIVKLEKGEHQKELVGLKRSGFSQVMIDGCEYDLSDLPKLDKNKRHSIDLLVDKVEISDSLGNRLFEAIEIGLRRGNGIVKASARNAEGQESELIFSEKFACPVSGFQIDDLEPRLFSFNSPVGACPQCKGTGLEEFFDPKLAIENKKKSIKGGALDSVPQCNTHALKTQAMRALDFYGFDHSQPFEQMPEDARNLILYGESSLPTATRNESERFVGIAPLIDQVCGRLSSENWLYYSMRQYIAERTCIGCFGYKINAHAMCVKIDGKNIGQVANLTVEDALQWAKNLHSHLNATQLAIGTRVLKEITARLQFLQNVGLEYLSLSRSAATLSGGESQRIRLASQIGSGLCGVLYVLDEPSIGLHQSDNQKLIDSLIALSKMGNSVIVVEHDHDTMLAADWLIDIGPGAGIHGGHVVACGTPQEVMRNEASLTGAYLSGRKEIAIPAKYRTGHAGRSLQLNGVTLNNVKSASITIPLGTFTCVTGVSGSGKSSLIIDTLYPAVKSALGGESSPACGSFQSIKGVEYLDKIIEIDQSPIGRTPRSNPATYTGVFDPIRDLFSGLPEAKARGYKVGRFSFNVKGGRCEACQGDGMIKVEMHFLADVFVACEECRGARYNKETLEVMYKGKSIADVLQMTVSESLDFFSAVPSIREKIKTLADVGLGYIKLGQSATTLSGGEAQRIKLAKELSRPATGRTLYILDEPTTGLHTEDISKLLGVLQTLVDRGNTIIVIEHNMDVIKTADYLIDVGPKGGVHGGRVIATGDPYQVAMNAESATGQYLKSHIFKVVQA